MLFIGHRLQGFKTPGSMGVVRDATFINCFWPKLDRPTRIFAEGSSGIKVMGTTPRNVWFPDDIEFLPFYPDALYPAERAVREAFPGVRALINLSPAQAQVWKAAYDAAVASFPPTHTVLETRRDVNFLRHREVATERTITLQEDSLSVAADGSEAVLRAGAEITKREFVEFVAELTPQECLDLMGGRVDEATLRATKTFVAPQRVEGVGQQIVTLSDWTTERLEVVELG